MPTEQKTRAQIYEAAKDELVRDIALLINSEGATGEMLHDMLDTAILLQRLSMRAEKEEQNEKFHKMESHSALSAKDIIRSSFESVIESMRDDADGPIIKL